MPTRPRRSLLVLLLFLGAAVVLASCASAAATQHPNGLTCQGTDCRFKCPDGRLLSLPAAVADQPKDQLNFLFCGVPLPESKAGSSLQSAEAFQLPPVAPLPLLKNQVNSCDLVKGEITFVMAQPADFLKGKELSVEIQGRPAQCGTVPSFPGFLSCKLPPETRFPAGIVVRLDNQIVNLFPYSGGVCEEKAGPQQAENLLPPPAPQPPPPPPPHPHPHPHGHGGHGHHEKPPKPHGEGRGNPSLFVPV